MTVRLDDQATGFFVEQERVRFPCQQVGEKFFEQHAPLGDFFRAGQFQFTIILRKHGEARRFEENNGRGLGAGGEQGEVVAP